MTFLDTAARNERDHEEQKELLRIQIRLLTDHRTELEDAIRHDAAHLDIAAEMLSKATGISHDGALALIADEYEMRQSRKAVTA